MRSKNGNVLSVQDADSNTTYNKYDEVNRLWETTDAENISVDFGYDAVGNRVSVTDGNGHTTRFRFDGLRRVTQEQDARGAIAYSYYDGVNRTQSIDRNGRQVLYHNDNRNRLFTESIIGALGINSRTYQYDLTNNLTRVTETDAKGARPCAEVDYTYDEMNRKTSVTSNGIQTSYQYDRLGNLLQVQYGGTLRTVNRTYDNLNRLVSINDGGSVTQYQYDIRSLMRTESMPNGDLVTKTPDELGRTKLIVGSGKGGALYQYATGYDLVGNVLEVDETYPQNGALNRQVINSYDNIYRLTKEQQIATGGGVSVTTTYGYDNANNRTSKTVTGGPNAGSVNYTPNNLNQITSTVGTGPNSNASFEYDPEGNRMTRTMNGVTTSYTYDYENRLLTVTDKGGALTHTSSYVYDYRTRRITRTVDGASTSVIYSGGVSVEEFQWSAAGQASLSAEYLRGPDMGGGVGGLLYSVRSGIASYTHINGRGDVTAKTDANGNLTYQSEYEAFGTHPREVGSSPDPQRANTKEEDPTQLVDEGQRYFDLLTGTFITRDPAGFVDGPNLYAYCVQNPWTMFDPEGLAALTDSIRTEILEDMQSAADIVERVYGPTNGDLSVANAKHATWAEILNKASRHPEFIVTEQSINSKGEAIKRNRYFNKKTGREVHQYAKGSRRPDGIMLKDSDFKKDVENGGGYDLSDKVDSAYNLKTGAQQMESNWIDDVSTRLGINTSEIVEVRAGGALAKEYAAATGRLNALDLLIPLDVAAFNNQVIDMMDAENDEDPYVGFTGNGQAFSLAFTRIHYRLLFFLPSRVDKRIHMWNGPYKGKDIPVPDEQWDKLDEDLKKHGHTMKFWRYGV